MRNLLLLALALAPACDGAEKDSSAPPGADSDTDSDTDADTDSDADADADSDADADTDSDADSDPQPNPVLLSYEKGQKAGSCQLDDEQLLVSDQGGGEVELLHICVVFNCCTELDPVLEFDSPVLTIVENETGKPCYCESWYNPSYLVGGFTAGEWTFRIDELEATLVLQ